MNTFKENYSLVLNEIRGAMDSVDEKQVTSLVDAILQAEKVFVVGVGRVMLSLKALAKRLNHLGISTHCVGDINEPAITDKDLLIVGSSSGESKVPVVIAQVAKKFNPKIAHIGSNPKSTLAPITDVFVRIPVRTKLSLPGEIDSKQIMTSLFEQSLYIFGDTVSLMIAQRRGSDIRALWYHHANLE